MSNIGLIIGHEYETRVMTKSFILTTLLTPLFMILAMALPTWLMTRSDKTEKQIAVIDKSGLYGDVFTNDDVYQFVYLDEDVDVARKQHTDLTGFLYISGDLTDAENTVTFYSEKQASSETTNHLRRLLNKRVEQQKIEASGIPNLKEIMKSVDTDLQIKSVRFSKDGKEQVTSAIFAELMGMMTALLIYMFILMYGSIVMRSVVQEKSNRIMEVMVASTRPFDLMMGKIIAVALVGLTQFIMWVVLLTVAGLLMLPMLISHAGLDMNISDAMQAAQTMQIDNTAGEVLTAIASFDFKKILTLFVLYFLGGYLLYSSMFAAIGSAVDNETDTQQFAAPISIVMMIAMYAGIYAAQHPEAPFTFWCSMIPFTSPVVMIVRLPFDVAWWEIGLSLAILIGSFIATTWLAAKIYRVGILMYGKKPSWKELMKWIKY